ncbi:MAG: hypothetical protein H6807_12265 [Planctomycetes bacterium]|nr:hypothetical protein [Planctomycetota bacterium]
MPRSRLRTSVLATVVVALASTVFVACGGGGGDKNATSAATVINTSFQGYPSFAGGGLPPVIRDEVLQITFQGAIDDGIFGGYYVEAGQTAPTAFQGGRLVNGTTVAVPYYAYANQAAARQALQILDNTGAVTGTFPGIVGRSVDDPRVLVFDPAVNASLSALFGVTMSQGFDSGIQYDVYIPANSGLTIGGIMMPSFGSPPPVTVPAFDVSQSISTLFQAGAGFLDRPAPAVMTITTENTELISGVAGFDPIPYDDTIVVRFTESIDLSTIDLQTNLIIRNVDIANSQQPNGVLVPVSYTIDSALRELRFVPQPNFGAGPFHIVVQVIKFDETIPTEDAMNIRGLPSGAAATQKALSGLPGIVAQVTFTTIFQAGEPTPISIIENFDSTANQNTTFAPVYNAAEWFANGVEQLRGFAINGEPLQTNLGTGPGARVQFTFQPPGTANNLNPNCTTPLCTYSSPFDDNTINNGINPNGGSRVQLLYLTNGTELPNNAPNALELVEWSPPAQTAAPVTYNGYTMNVGHTGNGDLTGGNNAQMTVIYPTNWDFVNPQNNWILPLTHPDGVSPPNKSPILCYGPAPYTVTQLSGVFIPFPRLTIPFDLDDTRTGANSVGQTVNPNIIVEHMVPAPHITQNMMVNVVIGTNETSPQPFRRAIGKPGVNTAVALDSVKYHTRMTIAKKNSSAQSNYYNSGAPATSNIGYNSITVQPALAARPANTRIELKLRSATSAAGAGATAFQTYFDLNGNLNLASLAALGGVGRAFFKFEVAFEADLLTNTVPYFDSMIFGLTF